jgi:hypothetical protein
MRIAKLVRAIDDDAGLGMRADDACVEVCPQARVASS